MSWSIEARQDSVFATAEDLLVTRLTDVKKIEEVLTNPLECGPGEEEGSETNPCTGDVIFNEKVSENSFSRSLPAMLRVGGAYKLLPKLTVVGNYDQAFSEGFGIKTTPRLSGGVEYTLVPWFPTRFGVSVGGRSPSSAIGFAFGPFTVAHMQLKLMETALVTRGGLFPGVSKGVALSFMFFSLKIT